ncbi:hypothetical protein [uncultured Aquimarina sp.]|uniref:hypothetical protein n=1 Tax=uncultured Aquimarina sp. TaxID=575652 RepID=UPI002635FA7D|nr:hypothetical protein [uncultured Aquimarina sp.]
MKTTVKFLTYIMMTFALVLTTSCDGEDGMDGAEGPQGPAGQDGNANVIVKTIDEVIWTSGDYLGAAANEFVITDTDIDQNALDNSLILVYFELFDDGIWHPMTLNFPVADGSDQVITFSYTLNALTIYSLSSGGELNAGITKLKYFIIEGTDTSSINFSSYEDLQSHYGLD